MNTVDITDRILVRINPQPKKQIGNSETYGIYLHFTISENGISTITSPVISTGLRVPVNEWDLKLRQMKGKQKSNLTVIVIRKSPRLWYRSALNNYIKKLEKNHVDEKSDIPECHPFYLEDVSGSTSFSKY